MRPTVRGSEAVGARQSVLLIGCHGAAGLTVSPPELSGMGATMGQASRGKVWERITRTVWVTGAVTDDQLAQIRAAAPTADVRYFATREALEARIAEAEIVAGHVTAPALARAARLRWVQRWTAGPDALLYPEMVASAVVCTCCKGNGAIPLAEHAIMLMLLLNRDGRRWLRDQEARRWEHRPHGELNGLTCGIIGLGHAGQDLALKCQAFHMRVLGIRRTPRPTPRVDDVLPLDRLHDLLAMSDFVVVTAPRTPETIGLLGEAEFRAMKSTAHYICFSRGGIADDRALLRCKRGGSRGRGWTHTGRNPSHRTASSGTSRMRSSPRTTARRRRPRDSVAWISLWRTCAATRPVSRS
ncbi:MAG TPA: NAD(P)-dependent oxidoreductase [Thermomicrobiales bacterium]|nr:NAD(P)-dependent oxidoreductase [Thermomicrobiales bacterium]